MKIIETQFNEMLNVDQIERVSIKYPCDMSYFNLIAFMKSQEEVPISCNFLNVNPIVLSEEIGLCEPKKRLEYENKCLLDVKAKAQEDYELCRDFLVSNDPFISFEKFDDFGPVPPPPNGK